MNLFAKILGRRIEPVTVTGLVQLGSVATLTLGAPGSKNKDGKYFYTQ